MINDFVVVLNSRDGVGALNTTKTFNFDWSVFEDCEYLVESVAITETISYGSSPNFMPNLLTFWGDFGSSNNVFTTSTTNEAINSSRAFLSFGCMDMGSTLQRAASKRNNPTIRMRRPRNNTFTIYLLDNDGNEFVVPSGSYVNTMTEWIMTLRFYKTKPVPIPNQINDMTLILNSKQGVSLTGAPNTYAIMLYRFDWSIFQEGKYVVEMTMTTEGMSIGVSPNYIFKLPLIYMTIGGTQNNVLMPTNNGYNGAVNSSQIFIGNMVLDAGTSSFRGSRKDLNPTPIITKPQSNDIIISVLDNDGVPYTTGGGSGNNYVAEYQMAIRFYRVED